MGVVIPKRGVPNPNTVQIACSGLSRSTTCVTDAEPRNKWPQVKTVRATWARIIGAAHRFKLPGRKPHGVPQIYQDGQRSSIDDIPNEILEKILLQTDLQGIGRCRQACKRLNELVGNSTLIQYFLELAINGLVDGPPGGLSVGERLQALRDRRKAWDTMQPTARKVIVSEYRRTAVLITQNHLILIPQPDPSELLATTQPPSPHQGVMTQIASLHRGIPDKTYAFGPLVAEGFIVKAQWDFGEDLLVIIQMKQASMIWLASIYSLRILSFATQSSHPKAIKDTITLDDIRALGMPSCRLRGSQVSFDYIGLELTTRDDERESRFLLVYNWKTGEFILCVKHAASFAFAFATEKYLLVGSIEDPSIDSATLSVLDLSLIQKQATRENHPITLHLTSVKVEEVVCQLQLPNPARADMIRFDLSRRSWRAPNMQVPFHMADDDRLLLISISKNGRGVTILAPLSTILQCIQQAEDEPRKRWFEWPEWGITGTHVLNMAPVSEFSPCGMRILVEGRRGKKQLKSVRSLTVRKHIADIRSGRNPSKHVHFSTQSVWSNSSKRTSRPSIITRLPACYTTIPPQLLEHPTKPKEFTRTQVTLGDDCIIIVFLETNTGGRPRRREYHILSF
ncbi:hypothetical protein BXZ70DRAFT_1007600 [Cristinia sonorae]|uniref:F-box domain-containing protein n=1 Tax=Cristinia sonorae TaxID=1940300 RepID=A0A8K0UQE8_9AGAR|nr:hypothetical protein BXZ70DRAFT_1007600 [Cristinia sonorae]